MSKIDFTLNEQTVQIERDSFHYIWNYFFIFTNSTEISVGFLIFSFFIFAGIIDLISTLISFVFTLQNSVRNVVKFYSRIQFEMKIRLMQCTYKPFAAEYIHRLNSNIFYDYPLCGCNHIFDFLIEMKGQNRSVSVTMVQHCYMRPMEEKCVCTVCARHEWIRSGLYMFGFSSIQLCRVWKQSGEMLCRKSFQQYKGRNALLPHFILSNAHTDEIKRTGCQSNFNN